MRRLSLLTIAVVSTLSLWVQLPASASSSTYDAANQTIEFVAPNPPNTSDVLTEADASTPAYRYSNVITISGVQIDALVSIVSLTNSRNGNSGTIGKLDRIDNNDNDIPLDVDFFNSASSEGVEGNVVFDVQFVAGGTSNPVTLQNVSVTVTDVDNNQFVQFSGLQSYKLISSRGSTDVQAFTGGASFNTVICADNRDLTDPADPANCSAGSAIPQTVAVPSGSTYFYATGYSSSSDSDAEKAKHHVEVQYTQVSTMRLKLGSFEMGGASFGVEFSVNPSFTTPPSGLTVASTSVTQPSFTKSYDANQGSGSAPTPVSGTGALTVAGSLASPSISRSGYTFAGWNTRADGTGVSYAPGSSILPVADVTLYAVWTLAPTPTPTPTPSPVVEASRLATTGSDNSTVLATISATAALFLMLGSFLVYRRRTFK